MTAKTGLYPPFTPCGSQVPPGPQAESSIKEFQIFSWAAVAQTLLDTLDKDIAYLLLSLLLYISVSFLQIKKECALLSLLAHLLENILILKIKEIPVSIFSCRAEHTCSPAPCALTTRPSLHRSDLMLFALSFDINWFFRCIL